MHLLKLLRYFESHNFFAGAVLTVPTMPYKGVSHRPALFIAQGSRLGCQMIGRILYPVMAGVSVLAHIVQTDAAA